MKSGNNKGFVMLEVMVVLMIVLLLVSILFASAGVRSRRARKNAAEEEAYYAAVAALKLMAGEVMEGDFESGTPASIISRGMAKRKTNIVFEPEDGSAEVEIPVTVWSVRDETGLILYAECTVDGQKKVVSFSFERQSIAVAAEVATASSASQTVWIPVGYELEN